MSLQVYFGETLIDEQYYTGLTNNNELFNESFKLGSTPSNTFKLSIAKDGVESQPSEIVLKDGGTTFANLQIDNIEEQDYEYVYTLTDKMVDLEFRYDASQIFQNGSTTLLLIAQDICSKVGLTLGTNDFRGYNKSINWYDNTRTAREYIGMIAELNGGFARIENNTLYFYKQKRNSVKTINIDECQDFNIGEYHKITRVVYELGTLKYEFGDETGNTLYLNSDNVYITEESEVEAIYNDIKDFEFYSFTTSNCPIDYNVKAGDIITFTDGTNDYPTIAQYDLEYFGGWIGGYNLSINTERQEETKIIGDKERIRDIKITVDRQNNTITQVVSEVDEQNTKIAQTQQSVNELNSKIQDIADITTQAETIYATLDFDSINQSEPIEVKIHPTTTNISYLYPRSNLYPSDTLYMPNRILRFEKTSSYTLTNDNYFLSNKPYYYYYNNEYRLLIPEENYTTGDNMGNTSVEIDGVVWVDAFDVYEHEIFDYELPDDLLINPNTGTYDEFYLGYDEQICQVTKRCQYNADGSVSDLANETINSYTYPIINLTDGDYTVELLGYNNGYLSVRLMSQNIYTTQFATKAELNSEISQTAEQIQSTVSATYETKQNAQTNYSQLQQTADGLTSTVATKVGNNEIISKINQSAEAVSINANKINLNGVVTANQNFKIKTDGSMEAVNGKFTGGKIILTGGTNQSDTNFRINDPNDNNVFTYITPRTLQVGGGSNYLTYNEVSNFTIQNTSTGVYFNIYYNANQIELGADDIYCKNRIHALSYHYDSLEKYKENINKFNKKALDIIKNGELYNFNYKKETKDSKPHVGFIIGEKYKTPDEIITTNNNAIDAYTMSGIMWKAIQEQQEQIEELQKEIKELKGDKEDDKD